MNSLPRVGILIVLLTTLFAGLPSPAQTPPPPPVRRGARATNAIIPTPTAMERQLRASRELQARRSSGLLTAHLHATIYEVQADADRLKALETNNLAEKADAALASALQATGKTRGIYHFDQPLNVFYGRILLGNQDPIATRINVTTNGPLPDRISYLNTGAILQVSANIPTNEPNHNPIVTFNLQLTGFAPGDISPPGPSGDLPMPRAVTLENAAPLDFGHATTLTAESLQNVRGKGVAPTLYVVRYIFDNPSAGQTNKVTTTNEVAETSVGTNATARFQATVYELDAIPLRVDTLNATTLAAHADTEEDLLMALNENGNARVVQHVDKPINTRFDKIQIGGNEMVPTRAILTGDGQIRFGRQAMRTGVTVDFTSQTIPAGKPGEGPAETTAFQFSCIVPSELDLAPGVPASAPRTWTTEDTAPLRWNQPRVFLAARSLYAREQQTPVVYIVRYVFSPLPPNNAGH